jgi:hypothetical protein
MVLAMDISRDIAATPPKLNEAELAKQVEEIQASWLQKRPVAEEQLGLVKVNYSYRLPGVAREVHGFVKEADGSINFVFDWAKVLQGIDQLMADPAYVRDCIKAGLEPAWSTNDPLCLEKLFGGKLPFTARVTGEMKPQFDYAAEVKAAKKAYPEMAKRLGLEK